MKTTMTLTRAIEVACKTLMADGNFTQDDRAGAYHVLMSHNVHLLQMTGQASGTLVPVEAADKKVEPTAFSTMTPKPVAKKSVEAMVYDEAKMQRLNDILCGINDAEEPEEEFVPTHVYIGNQRGKNGQKCIVKPLNNLYSNFVGTFEDGALVHAGDKYFTPIEPTKSVLELVNTTPAMNIRGFNDCMKFEMVKHGCNVSLVRHIRTGKFARLNNHYLNSVEIPLSRYNDMVNKKANKEAYKGVDF